MGYDKRCALVKHHCFWITDENTKNSYSVTVEKEIGRGGSCIVYRGIQKDHIGRQEVARAVIIKEFYPKALDFQIRRLDTMDLVIPKEIENQFEERLDRFCEGQAKHIIYANDHAGCALPPVSFSGTAHGTFYAVSNQGQGVALSAVDRLRFCSYSNGWVAPEQKYCGDSGYADPKKIGFHTDIFSIGAVLFYLLTGRSPTERDIERIQTETGFDWKNSLSLPQKEAALDDRIFLQELDRIMRKVLNPDAKLRKADYGLSDSAIKVKNEFMHLADLAETAPERHSFEKTDAEIQETRRKITDAKADIEQAIQKYSFKNFLFGSKKRILASAAAILVIAFILGAASFWGGRLAEKMAPAGAVEIERDMDAHILLKLSDANHQYEVGLENWRRLDYNRAERDILAARNDISEEKSQSEIEVAKINHSLGYLYLDMGRYADAYDYLSHAYITFRDTCGEEDVGTLSILFSIAQYDYYSGDIDTALKTLQQIRDEIDLDQNKAVAASILHFQALIYDELGDAVSAVAAYQNVLDLYGEILEDGKYTEAFSNYVNDPQLTQNEKDEYTEAIRWVILTYCNLGEAYIHAGDYDAAQYILETALEMSLDNIYIGTKDLTTSRLYMHLAQVYASQGV